MRNRVPVWFCALAATTAAIADIEEWSDASSGFEINDNQRTIWITAPGTYKFHSLDPNGEPSWIEWIRVDPNVDGAVTVHVSRDPNDKNGDPNHPGASDLKQIDLTNADSRRLAVLRISNDLGDPNYSVAVIAASAGTLVTGGNVIKPMTVDSIDGPVVIYGSLTADLTCDALGDLAVRKTLSGDVLIRGTYSRHAITVGQDGGSLSGNITIDGVLEFSGISVMGPTGDLSGTVHARGGGDYYTLFVEGSLTGSFVLDDFSAGGGPTIRIAHDLTGAIRVNGYWVGCIAGIGGDMSGTFVVSDWFSAGNFGVAGELIDPNHDLSGGHVIVNGYFISGSITFGSLSSADPFTEFIAVGYDAGCSPTFWLPDAVVRIGQNSYYGNTPTQHVWQISECVGDLDGDGYVTLADWTALYLLVQDPGAYALQFAGLGPTATCHGDTTCDGIVDASDLDALTNWIGWCEQCPEGERRQQEYTPDELARALTDATPPDRFDLLVEGSALLAGELPARERRIYWSRVHEELQK